MSEFWVSNSDLSSARYCEDRTSCSKRFFKLLQKAFSPFFCCSLGFWWCNDESKQTKRNLWEHLLHLLVRCVWELRKYGNKRYISCQFKVAQHQSWHLLIMVEMIEIHQNHNFALCVEFPLIHTLLGENTQQNKVVHVDHVAQIMWRLQVSVPCLLPQYKVNWSYELFSSWGKTNQSDQTELKSDDVKRLWCWQIPSETVYSQRCCLCSKYLF